MKQILSSTDGWKINFGAIIPTEKIMPLFEMMSHSARFKDVRMRAYVNEIDHSEEKQFSAICFDLPTGATYVAFRGTDDNLISWKEDLNMALFTPIPSQRVAVEYLNKIGHSRTGRLYLGGHSKGGNLAVYSAFMADKEVQSKIISVHSFDGPGFRQEFIKHIKEPVKMSIRYFISIVLPITSSTFKETEPTKGRYISILV